jgi:hypothetical protein
MLYFVGFLGVLHEYACGALGGRLLITAPAALRKDNRGIIPARLTFPGKEIGIVLCVEQSVGRTAVRPTVSFRRFRET